MISLFRLRKSFLVSFLSSTLFIFGYTSAMPVASQGAGQDCDDNAVIRCGVSSAAEIKSHYSGSTADIFGYFGISKADADAMDAQAVVGDVYSNGDIKVQMQSNGQTGYHLVATDAMTAGRQNIPGSTPPPAAPTKHVTKPHKAPPPKQVSPAQTQIQSQTQTQYVTVNEATQPVTYTPPATTTTNNYYTQPQQQAQTQASTTPTYTTPAAAPAKIPNTGPGNVIGLGAIVGTVSGFGHFFFTRLRRPRFDLNYF